MARGTRARASGAFALQIDACGLAMVVRAANEAPVTWWPSALALPTEASRVAVLVTPQASANHELADRLLDLMSRFLGGTDLGVRVLPLGAVGPIEVIDRWARSLAAKSGREIVVPHGRTVLKADGSVTVLGPGGEFAEWAAWQPGATEAIIEPVRPGAEVPVMVSVILDRSRPGGDRGARHLPAVACDLAITPGGWMLPVAPARRWRPGTPLPKAPPAARRRPDIAPATDPGVPGAPTIFGWSFVVDPAGGGHGARSTLPVPAGPAVPPDAWFVVEVELRAGLPKIGGRPVAPAGLARQIAACPGRHGRPVLLVTVGATLRPGMATALYGALADELGTPVIACAGPIRVDRRGDLETPGCFRSWHPRSGGADREVIDLGRFVRARPARTARLRPPVVSRRASPVRPSPAPSW